MSLPRGTGAAARVTAIDELLSRDGRTLSSGGGFKLTLPMPPRSRSQSQSQSRSRSRSQSRQPHRYRSQHHSQLRSSHIRTRTDLLGVFPRARGSIPLPLCTGRTLYARAHAGAPPPTHRRKTGPSY
ncbi:hypothetical protein MYA_4506 [Burkholderia sp. KJ006]|nr:hypothetical protein MYA_4506 [Burkholderia sp. KJ006]